MNDTKERPGASAGQTAALLSEAADAAEQTVVPALQEALLEVSEEPAFALELSLFEGKEDTAIASIMNVSEEDVRDLQEEAREQLLRTEFGQKVGRSDLHDVLKLAGTYLRHQGSPGQFQEGLSKALEMEKRSIPERISESTKELWRQVARELDATADQLVGAGTAVIEGFGPTRAMAASSEKERERKERDFEVDIELRCYGKLTREVTGQWRIVFEVHEEDIEAMRLGYEIAGRNDTVLHRGNVHLERFSKGVYEGGEMIGSLEAPEGTSLEIRVIEVELEERR